MKQYLFVIDTDSYAGNFEREMTAYITGRLGDCGVGSEFSEIYKEETGDFNLEKFDDYIDSRPDDNGCHSPCLIYPTPGYFNHGLGGHFKNGQEKEALEDYIKQCEKFYGKESMATPLRAKAELEAGRTYSNWTLKGVDSEIKRLNKKVDSAKKLKRVRKYPAYQSVGICFYEFPPKELIDLMKTRALTFAAAKRTKGQSWDKNFNLEILGFRWIEERIVISQQAI